MAVTGPFMPNLSGAYQNIQEALSQGANIAARNTGPMGTLAAGVQPITDEMVAARQASLKASLEDHLNRNKIAYAAQAEGKSLTTSEELGTLGQQAGLDPKIFKDVVPDEGIWQTPEEKIGLVNKLKRQDVVEQMAQQKFKTDPWGGNLLHYLARTDPSPETDQLIARMAGISQVDRVPGPQGGYIYIDHYTKQPIAGLNQFDGSTPGGAKDLYSLRNMGLKYEAQYLQDLPKQMENDPKLKPLSNTMDELDRVKDLITANIPGSQINIGADTARAVGGVPGGKFTALVSMQEGKDPSLWGTLGQKYQTISTGKLSKNNQQLLLNEVGIAKKTTQTQLAKELQDRHTQIKTGIAPHASDDLIANQLGYQRYLQASDTVIKIKDKSGKTYTLNDPSKLQDYLDAGYTRAD